MSSWVCSSTRKWLTFIIAFVIDDKLDVIYTDHGKLYCTHETT